MSKNNLSHLDSSLAASLSKMASKLWPSLLLAALAFLPFAPQAHAEKWANQFAEFELPAKWQCTLEGAEWVCQGTDEETKRDAIIILAAKFKGEQDTLEQYLSYLKNPKSFVSVTGKNVTSEPVYAKATPINEQTWIDSMHKDSEIPGFMTRYLATVKQDIGVLVTYSILKSKYQDYLQDFETLVKTLRVFRKSGGLNSGGGSAGGLFTNTQLPAGISEGTVFPGGVSGGGSDGGPKVSTQEDFPWIYAAAGVGLLLFIIWRRRQGP